MKLTAKEQEICDKYGARDKITGKVRCAECPLSIDHRLCICYANIDGRTAEAKGLKRYL